MKTRILSSIVVILGVVLPLAVSQSYGQSNPRYIPLGSATGVLYRPDSGVYSHVGIIQSHPTSNNFGCGTAWASRGFIALCLNTRYFNNEPAIDWETIILDIRAGVNFIKTQPGITKVVLVGPSGGGPLVTFYQNVAENGPSVCQGTNKLVQCDTKTLTGLPRVDGIILNDAIPGYGVNAVTEINPAVFNERRPDLVKPALDPFDPKNGYNPNGSSTYSAKFKAQYFAEQAERMNRLVADALEKRAEIDAGVYRYPDDDDFTIARGGGGGGSGSAALRGLDLSLDCCTTKPAKLLKNDGTIVTQIVHSVRVANPGLAQSNKTFAGSRDLTVMSFLSLRAIRATNSFDGVDISSNNNSTDYHLQNITVPLLVVSSGGHYFIPAGEKHYDAAKSQDKDFIVIEGAAHTGPECVPCESFPGQYANSLTNQINYMRDWVNQPGRF
jgi:pimeloyl-ACP methyl ester carboxylesterase